MIDANNERKTETDFIFGLNLLLTIFGVKDRR